MNAQELIEAVTILGHSPMNIHIFLHDEGTDKLTEISANIKKLMATQADLDAAIAALTADLDTQIAAIDTAVQAIINKIGGTSVDLSAEIASLQAVQAKLDTIPAQLPTTVTP